MEDLVENLHKLGFTELEAKVYIYLVKKRSKTAREISRSLELTKVQTYTVLKGLQKKSVIEPSIDYPCRFKAVPAKKAFDIIINTKKQEAVTLERVAESTLLKLESMQYPLSDDENDRFTIICDMNRIVSLTESIMKSTFEVKAIFHVLDSVDAGRVLDFFNTIQKINSSRRLNCKFITNVTAQTIPYIEMCIRDIKNSGYIQVRHNKINTDEYPRFAVFDRKETIFFLNSNTTDVKKPNDSKVLYTNNERFVHMLIRFWDSLWKKSIPINQEIEELSACLPQTRQNY